MEDDGAEGISDFVGDAGGEEAHGFEAGLAFAGTGRGMFFGDVAEEDEVGGVVGVGGSGVVGEGDDLHHEAEAAGVSDGDFAGEVRLGVGVTERSAEGGVAENVSGGMSNDFLRLGAGEVVDAGVGEDGDALAINSDDTFGHGVEDGAEELLVARDALEVMLELLAIEAREVFKDFTSYGSGHRRSATMQRCVQQAGRGASRVRDIDQAVSRVQQNDWGCRS